MAMNKAKSGLMSRLGNKLDEAVRKHADDPTDYGVIRIPPGVNNGVAQLTECKFDIYKTGNYQGEYYFRAVGTALEPESVIVRGQEQPVAGLTTSIMIPVCDTKNSKGEVTPVEQHIDTILNEMRKLGAQTEGCTGADLESLAESLKEAAPYFRFSTSQSAPTPQYPDPKVWENWHGSRGLDDYVPPDMGGAVQDETPPPAKAPTTRPAATNGKATAAPAPKPNGKAPAPAKKAPPAIDDYSDIDSLVQFAGDDKNVLQDDAQQRLSDLATEAGATEEEISEAADWRAVADLIEDNASKRGGEGGDSGEEGLKVGDVVRYTPIDQKTKKPAKGAKPVDCEVLEVSEERQRAALKNIDKPGVIYNNVPLDQLTPTE